MCAEKARYTGSDKRQARALRSSLIPGEVQQLAEDSGVLVVRVPRRYARNAYPDIVVVVQVRQGYTSALHLTELMRNVCSEVPGSDEPRNP